MNGERELNPVADAEPIGHAGGPAEQEAARGPRFARHGHEQRRQGRRREPHQLKPGINQNQQARGSQRQKQVQHGWRSASPLTASAM